MSGRTGPRDPRAPHNRWSPRAIAVADAEESDTRVVCLAHLPASGCLFSKGVPGATRIDPLPKKSENSKLTPNAGRWLCAPRICEQSPCQMCSMR